MNAIYEGTVRHRRFAERRREFSHRISMAYVDLGQVPPQLLRRWPGIVRFRRCDYLGDPAVPLDVAVRARVEEETGSAPDGPIRVLTQLRTFGHCFNPVSFYFCFDRDERLDALVAEVTNTPWGERHSYVLRRDGARGRVLQGESPKQMHVSPFFGMDQRYEWRVAEPGPTLSVHIENHAADGRAFDATLSLRRRAMTGRALRRHPLATLRILALIYAHAIGIRARGIRTHPHPARAAG